MNNEIEQIAQQNDMSVEFVRWFFSEKKAACGEQWFLALGAMWEGWKAREGEVTALVLTLEKSREASGCPAGVDLQDWVKQLAEENVRINHFIAASCYVQAGENASWCPAIDHAPETTATDAVLTELRNEAGARAVELFAKTLGSPYSFRDEKCYEDGFTRAIEIVRDAQAPRFAKKLREGADK